VTNEVELLQAWEETLGPDDQAVLAEFAKLDAAESVYCL
jgi:hypothetical protein